MQPSLILPVLSLLVSTTTAKCLDLDLADIVLAFDCGDAPTIAECLNQKTRSTEPCLLALGCPSEQIRAGIKWMRNDCSHTTHPKLDRLRELWQAGKPQELKKRTTSSTASVAAAATTTTAAKTTISSASTTTTSSKSSSSSPTSSISAVSSSVSSSGSLSAAVQTGSCITTSTSTYSYCITSTGTSTCGTTSALVEKCAAGMLCATPTYEPNAEVVCMKIDNSLTTSGLVITIFLATVLATLIGSLLYMCFSAQKASNAAKLKRESMFISTAELNNNSEADLPLISSAGPAGGYSGGYTETSGGNGVAGARSGPRLHPGLVETPIVEEDTSYLSRR